MRIASITDDINESHIFLPNSAKCVLFSDMDGTLSTGNIIVLDNKTTGKQFHARNGHGMALLRDAGIFTVLLSGANDGANHFFAKCWGAPFFHTSDNLAASDKLATAQRILTQLNWSGPTAAIGDDTPDVSLLQYVQHGACPSDAHVDVLTAVGNHTVNTAANGAFREFADFLIALYTD